MEGLTSGRDIQAGFAEWGVGMGDREGARLGQTRSTSIVKQENSAFSTVLGNQLGITFRVGGFQARHCRVVGGCSCRVGVCGESALEEGFGDGEDHQHQDVAAHVADFLHTLGMQEGILEM